MAQDFAEALKLALERLRISDRFESEVDAYLKGKGYSAGTIAEVVSRLKDRKILDDRRTALNLIELKSGRRSVGIEKMRAELMRRGAPEETIDECLAALPQEGEVDRMIEALRARFKAENSRTKAGRFLLARGFSEERLEEALDRFFGSEVLPD